MGVKGLWEILSELCERQPLTYLAGKKVAIDLSGWVVQAIQCQGLKKARNPHLRNLFFRVYRLLELGVFPIFVTEGKPPILKGNTIRSRNADRHGGSNINSSVSRSYFDGTLKQCENLLNTLGVPCVKSPGEAEAFCALLCLNDVVSGVITEDNDAFLYGADVVYKDFSVEPNDSHVNIYCLKSTKNKHDLDQNKLIALALLLGCDYTKGVPGIGKETAVKLLNELNCVDFLQRFKHWKNLEESELFPGLETQPLEKGSHCNRCEHLGTSSMHKKNGCSACDSEITCYLPNGSKPCRCPWHKNEELLNKWKTELKIYKTVKKSCPDFPDMRVVDEYLKFSGTIPSDDVLDWKCPKLVDFQEFSLNMLGWTIQYSFEKTLPLITSWQQYQLGKSNCDKSDFFCEPVEILKERSLKGDSYFEVKWRLTNKNCDLPIDSESLITTEFGEKFAISYKDLVDDFFKELNAQKEAKKKTKRMKVAKDCRKVKSNSPVKYSDTYNSQEQSPVKTSSCNHPIFSLDTSDIANALKMEISSVKESSYSDSFNGLLDVPLFERIKIMPKALLQNYETPLPKMPDNANEIVDFLFCDSLNDSSFSPLLVNSYHSMSNAEKLENEINMNYKIEEKLNLSVQMNNDQIGNLFLSDSLNDTDDTSFCINYNNLLATKNDSKIEGMDISVDEVKKSIPEQEAENVFVANPAGLNNTICLDFSHLNDSGDSFLNLLSQRQQYHQNFTFSPECIKIHEDISNKRSCPTDLDINFIKKETFGLNVQNVSTPLMKKSNLSPLVIYSLKHSNSSGKKKICPKHLLSKIFNNSSPKIETQILPNYSIVSTPNSSKMSPHFLYSPLVFDSSTDEL